MHRVRLLGLLGIRLLWLPVLRLLAVLRLLLAIARLLARITTLGNADDCRLALRHHDHRHLHLHLHRRRRGLNAQMIDQTRDHDEEDDSW